jgi:hypothetical protein
VHAAFKNNCDYIRVYISTGRRTRQNIILRDYEGPDAMYKYSQKIILELDDTHTERECCKGMCQANMICVTEGDDFGSIVGNKPKKNKQTVLDLIIREQYK